MVVCQLRTSVETGDDQTGIEGKASNIEALFVQDQQSAGLHAAIVQRSVPKFIKYSQRAVGNDLGSQPTRSVRLRQSIC